MLMACSFLSISVEMFFRCIYLRRLAVRHDWSIIWWMSGLFVIVALYCGSLHWFLSWPLELIIPMASLNLDLLLVYLAGATNYVDRNARWRTCACGHSEKGWLLALALNFVHHQRVQFGKLNQPIPSSGKQKWSAIFCIATILQEAPGHW
ncbi:unnamed protein product, partial [Durusdinium trenchii]